MVLANPTLLHHSVKSSDKRRTTHAGKHSKLSTLLYCHNLQHLAVCMCASAPVRAMFSIWHVQEHTTMHNCEYPRMCTQHQ